MAHKLTQLQESTVKSLSQDAQRLFNDLVNSPNYRGGLASNQGKVDLRKAGLVNIDYNLSGDPTKDVVWFTRKGEQIAKKMRAAGIDFISQLEEQS